MRLSTRLMVIVYIENAGDTRMLIDAKDMQGIIVRNMTMYRIVI